MDSTNAFDTLGRVFAQHAARTFLDLPHTGRSITYSDFWHGVEDLALRLHTRGLPRGGRVVIRLKNHERVLALYLACARIGLVACPLDPELPPARVQTLAARVSPVLSLDDAAMDALESGPAPDGSLPPAGEPSDDFLVLLSSGSTGEPKGIVHSLASLVQSAQAFGALSGLGTESVVYHHFPMFYMAGIFNLFFCPMVSGSRIVIGPTFSYAQMLRFWEIPISRGVNHLTLTPTMAQSLCQLHRRDDRLPAHLAQYEAVISTGSALHASVARRFLETFGVPLRTCYGVTEVGGSITLQSWEDAVAFESMGRWCEGVEIRAGSEEAPSEILVRTPYMMKGYLTPQGLDARFDADGFFHTGDLGYVREGTLFFSGREHDLVKKGGEFVSTQLIEDTALRSNLVAEAAVVGVPDEFWGCKLVLFYIPRQGAEEPQILAEMEKAFADHLRKIERPDKVIPVPWMPRTSIGKVVKRQLVDKYTLAR